MRRVLIGGIELLTSNEFGSALLDYAVRLGLSGSTGVATIAAVADDGARDAAAPLDDPAPMRARLVLGPGTPLVVLDARSVHPEPVDDELLQALRQKGRPGLTTIAWELPADDFDVFGLPGVWDEVAPGMP